MRIAVIGPGAMGSVFAAGLAEAGHEVVLLARRPLYARAIARRAGLSVERDGAERLVPCRLTLDPADLARCELALVLVKSGQTEQAALAARSLPAGRAVLTLQNGLGNMEILREHLPDNPVLAGVTTCAATLLEPGRSRLVSVGATLIGPEDPAHAAEARAVADLLDRAGFPSEATPDPRPALWRKLLINIAVNPLTALTGLRNGDLASSRPLCAIAGAAMAEGRAVALALGLDLPEEGLERFLAVCAATADNCSSMAQDIRAGRPTEIEALNGAVSRLGRKAGIATPVNDTLADLVRGVEGRSGNAHNETASK